MFTKFATAIALTTAAFAAVPALAAQPVNTADLVSKVQAEAAWQGVEVSRIQRTGNKLVVFGADRQGRDVSIDMTCKQLSFTCRAVTMAAATPATPAIVSGASVTSGQ